MGSTDNLNIIKDKHINDLLKEINKPKGDYHLCNEFAGKEYIATKQIIEEITKRFEKVEKKICSNDKDIFVKGVSEANDLIWVFFVFGYELGRLTHMYNGD